MSKDQDELNEILVKSSDSDEPSDDNYPWEDDCEESTKPNKSDSDTCQWSRIKKGMYIPVGLTSEKLPPGYYEIDVEHGIGLFFRKIEVKTENLIHFPDHNSDLVISEISKFWTKGKAFERKGFPFKRGILMWGPPGSGKTCTLQILMRELITEKKGICLRFGRPNVFIDGLRILRRQEPETPIIIVMEDLDGLFQRYNESDILNLLDGVEKVHKIVFLATTNYPEKLGARVVNRPSRFDKRFKIGYPSADSRKLYLESLFDGEETKHDLEKWVRDSKKFTFAHLKELFVAVNILGDDYVESIKTLKSMRDVKIQAKDAEGRKAMGFFDNDEENCVKTADKAPFYSPT